MLLDRLINSRLAADFETLYRARVLCVIFLAALFAFCISSIYFFFIAELSEEASRIAGFSTLLLAAALTVGLCNLYFCGRLIYNSYFLVVILLLAIFISTLFTGGIESSPVFPIFVLPLLIAFALLGNRAGLVFGFLTASAYWVAAWIDQQGIELPLYMDLRYRMIHLHVNWMVSFAMLTALMCATNIMYEALRLQRDNERDRYEFLAAHDSLTGLYNRMMFDELLLNGMSRAIRQGSNVALLYIDLDKFKPINDDYGHRVGDYVLQEVAVRLLEVARASDTAARVGGDEFAIIVEGEALTLEGLSVFAERVARKIHLPLDYSGEQFQVGCSIGIACYPASGASPEQLFKAADDAMYRAKKSAKDYMLAS